MDLKWAWCKKFVQKCKGIGAVAVVLSWKEGSDQPVVAPY